MPEHHRCCCVIPVFDQPQRLAGLVGGLLDLGLDIIIIDDGSGPVTADLVRQLAAGSDRIHAHHLPRNRGKGAAVLEGFARAQQRQFSHVLQIDADQQHSLDDVPRLLAASRSRPAALICGARSYADMPSGRRRGRRFTDLWVCINTISRAIADSMCGFRVYPLQATMAALADKHVGQRMDFDTDIAVRLYWAGIEVVNVPVQVRYDDEAPSHFDLLGDNLRITLMHTRHFLGMLWRLPSLLRR